MPWILIILTLLLSACGKDHAEVVWEVESEWIERGPVKAKIALRHASFSILDQQDLKLTIQSQANVMVHTPQFLDRLEDYRIVPWKGDIETTHEGVQTLEKFVRFECFESGPQSLPPFAVTFFDHSGEDEKKGNITLPSLSFDIQGIDDPSLIQKELEDHFQLHQPPPPPWKKWLGWAWPIVMATGAFFWWWSKRNPKASPPPPPEPAHQWAWRALEGLIQEQEAGLNNETFVDRISLILRIYIEKRFGLHAPEQTTEEFLASGFKSIPQLSEHQGVISQFLEYADLIKFAGQSAKSEEVQQGFDFIKTFITATQEAS
jgi:hypothetical protein